MECNDSCPCSVEKELRDGNWGFNEIGKSKLTPEESERLQIYGAESFSAEETEGARCMRRLDEMIDSMQESADGYLTRHPVDGYSTQYPDMKVVLPSDEHEDYTEVADGMVESTDAQQLAADMVLRAMEMRDMSDDLGSNLEYDAESFSAEEKCPKPDYQDDGGTRQ